MFREAYHWILAWSDSPYAVIALFCIAFVESFFLLPPPDIPLMAMVLGDPSRSMWFASVATAGSALGGICGYCIGMFGGKLILHKLLSKEKIAVCHDYFEKYEAWAIGIAGFTPIPYKVFTISAGAFAINFPKFVIVSILSRGLRFFIVALLLSFFGEEIKVFIEEYFNILSMLIVFLIVAGFYLLTVQGKKHAA